MPGTIGSFGGLVIYFFVFDNDFLYALSILLLFALGILFAGEAERHYGIKDPPAIVIDETCGMLLALFFVPPSIYSVILGFIFFRLFDILKPPPMRKIEKMKGSLGIMFDDIAAALYTNIFLQIIFRNLLG
jgi:phosphatidylglycerophosphatase A